MRILSLLQIWIARESAHVFISHPPTHPHTHPPILLYISLSQSLVQSFSRLNERPLPWLEPHQFRSLLMDKVLGTSFTATQAEYQQICFFRISESFQRELSPCLMSLRDVKSHKCFSSHSQVLSRIHELFAAQSVSHILMHLRTLYMHILHLRRRLDFLRFSSTAVIPFMLLTAGSHDHKACRAMGLL